MKTNVFLIAIATVVLSTVFFLSPAQALPTNFTTMYVFGDSLSDIGNDYSLSGGAVPPSTEPELRYYEGQFSNGPVWVDSLAQTMGISDFKPSLTATSADFTASHSINFAYGGAGTGIANITPDGLFIVRGLLGQIEDFNSLSGGGYAPANALYVVWSGANDYLLAGAAAGIPAPPNPAYTVGNIATAMQTLYNEGARNFLVPNLFDLGNLPISAFFGTGVQQALSDLTKQNNALLNSMLHDLVSTYSGIIIYSPDIYSLYAEIAADPSAFGFTHTLTEMGPAAGCLILPVILGIPADCNTLNMPNPLDGQGYPVWDEEHPTTAAHALIAQTALDASAIPEPFTAALFIMGLAGLVMVRFREIRN